MHTYSENDHCPSNYSAHLFPQMEREALAVVDLEDY